MVDWLEFNVLSQHKYGYIRHERWRAVLRAQDEEVNGQGRKEGKGGALATRRANI